MITVNGRKMSFQEGMTIEDLLERCRYTLPLIIVRVNGELVRKEEYGVWRIEDGDTIAVIHLMGGG